MYKKTLAVIILVLFIIVTICYMRINSNDEMPEEYSESQATEVAGRQAQARVFKNSGRDINRLTDAILEVLQDEADNYSIYYRELSEKTQECVINNRPRRSASMIKVFIMAHVMEQAKENKIDLEDRIVLRASDKVGGSGIICGWDNGTLISIRELTELMITESDNTATNILINQFGMENINSYIRDNGYADTVLRRKMMDTDSIAAGIDNFSSVKDLGTIFTRIACGDCVNGVYDKFMVDILLKQTDDEIFPTALPDCKIAHKTGELDNLYDDGGIIYGACNNYVLVIMNDDIVRSSAIATMQRIAKRCK